MRQILLVSCALAVVAGCSSASRPVSDAPSTTIAASTTVTRSRATESVHGTWVNATPATSLGSTALGFKQRSGTTWTGDLVGSTSYVAYTRSDPKHPGVAVGTIDEVFTGSVNGIGRGHLYLSERFTIADKGGAIRNAATIKRGDGGLTGVTGTIVFVGTLDLNADGLVAVSGLGHGTYTGAISH